MEPPSTLSPAAAGRWRLPRFISDLWADPAAFRTLIAASAAIAAVGLDPRILDPGMPTVRAAVKQDEDVRSLLMLGAVIQAGMLLLGGYLADRHRSERLMRAALGGLVLASLLAIGLPDGISVVPVRMVAWLCAGLVLPFAIGAIAHAYSGPARATALGVGYGVLGATTAIWPALATLDGPQGSPWPAFALCAIVATVAFAVSRMMPDLPGATVEHRPTMVAVALFAFGIVAVVASLIHVGGGFDALRMGTLVMGIGCLVLSFLSRVRGHRGMRAVDVDLRPVAVALAVGVVIGFAQAGPMLQLPQFFTSIQGARPLMATVAMAPFVVALLVAGPVSGWLLARFRPRALIAGGTVAIGIANLILAAILAPAASYALFVAPYLLIGAGFVIATTVRTAIIFASVPKDLPASAAALNEASIGMGSRIGVVVAVVITTTAAVDAYARHLAGMPSLLLTSEVERFRHVLDNLSLYSTTHLMSGVDLLTVAAYEEAAVVGMRIAWLIPGIVAIVAGVLAFFALGARGPVRSVWELADERPGPGDPAPSGTLRG